MARLSAVDTFEFVNSPGHYSFGMEFSRTKGFLARGAYWYFKTGGPATLKAQLWDVASEELLAEGEVSTTGWAVDTWHEVPFALPFIGRAGVSYAVSVEQLSGESAYSNSAAYPIAHDDFTIIQDRYASGGGWPVTPWTGAHSVGLSYEDTEGESLFDTEEPTSGNAPEGTAVVTGTTFVTDAAGAVSHIRYRAPDTVGDADTYTFGIYELATNSSGTLLGSVQVLGSALVPGQWNHVPLDAPVYLDTTHAYRVAAHAPNGFLVATNGGFNSPITNGSHLTAIQDNTDPFGGGNLLRNGCFVDNPSLALPSGQFLASNYFVDVVFLPGVTPPSEGALHVRFGGLLVATEKVGVVRLGGLALPFGPDGGGEPGIGDSLWGETVSATPQTDGGAAGITVGTTFIPQVNGTVTHLRAIGWNGTSGSTAQGALFELTDNTAGDLLGTTAVFSGLASGPLPNGDFGTVEFSAPIPVVAGRPYVIAVWHSAGYYWSGSAVFQGSGLTSAGGNLYAPATAEQIQYDTGLDAAINGRFKLNAALGLPFDTFNGGAYFVDLVFQPD